MKWEWLHFAELTPKQLYDVLQLRELVFQIEQRCLYRDIDDIDLQAKHLLGYVDEQLIAYLRVSLQRDEIVISRIVVTSELRQRGIGRAMVSKTLERLLLDYPDNPIVLSSQLAACDFYQDLGFIIHGDSYDDAGIAHVKMYLQREVVQCA